MENEITNTVLLQHIQGMKYELQQQIQKFKQEVHTEFRSVHEKLKQATQHRQALQEDLEATIKMQMTHQKKLQHIH